MNGLIKYWLLLLVLLMPILVKADTIAPPKSYVQPSADNKFVFVMIAPIDINQDGITSNEAGQREARRVRETYSSSGMYLNNGSTTPLWMVDWHSNRVFVSSDGEHVVRMGGYATELSGEALTIFKRNDVLRSYTIGELIDFKPLLDFPGNINWKDTPSLSDERQTFAVSTVNKESYVFNYTTGEMVSSRRPVRLIGVVLIIVIFSLAFVIFKYRWSKVGKRLNVFN